METSKREDYISIQQQQIEELKQIYLPHVIEEVIRECNKYNRYIIDNDLPADNIPRGGDIHNWVENRFIHKDDILLKFIPGHYQNLK